MRTFRPSPGHDRRRTPRFRVAGTRLRGHSLEARLVDFSSAGVGLETHAGLRIGATYRFRLSSGCGRPIVATVCWCRLRAVDRRCDGDVHPIYRAGLVLC